MQYIYVISALILAIAVQQGKKDLSQRTSDATRLRDYITEDMIWLGETRRGCCLGALRKLGELVASGWRHSQKARVSGVSRVAGRRGAFLSTPLSNICIQ